MSEPDTLPAPTPLSWPALQPTATEGVRAIERTAAALRVDVFPVGAPWPGLRVEVPATLEHPRLVNAPVSAILARAPAVITELKAGLAACTRERADSAAGWRVRLGGLPFSELRRLLTPADAALLYKPADPRVLLALARGVAAVVSCGFCRRSARAALRGWARAIALAASAGVRRLWRISTGVVAPALRPFGSLFRDGEDCDPPPLHTQSIPQTAGERGPPAAMPLAWHRPRAS